MRYKKSFTWQDEVRNKIDVIVERVMVVLEMRPRQVKFRIVLLPSDTEIQQLYKAKYNKQVDYIAFYSPKEKTVYISVNDMRTGVLAHELGHMVIDFYYGVAIPVNTQEFLAQFVETHLMD